MLSMENIELVKTRIEQILNQFMQEELGNRLSQFAILFLKSAILDELNKLQVTMDNGDNDQVEQDK